MGRGEGRTSDRRFTIVAYDIADDPRRNRVAKVLLGYGDRVEESVFEAWLSPGELDEMERDVAECLEVDVDVVRVYILCRDCVGRTRTLGPAAPPSDPPVVVL